MPADALAPEVARASIGTVMNVWDWKHVLLLQCKFHQHVSNQIQVLIQDIITYFIIFEKIQHIKS